MYNDKDITAMSPEECKKEMCNMIMFIENEKLIHFLVQFIKSSVCRWE